MTLPPPPAPRPPRTSRWRRLTLGACLLLAVVLCLPERPVPAPAGAGQPVFVWGKDAFWAELEEALREARTRDPAALAAQVEASRIDLHRQLDDIAGRPVPPDDPALLHFETSLFRFAPLVAAQPQRIDSFITLVDRLRRVVKEQSRTWDLQALASRQTLYRLLHGSRLALETLLLQLPEGAEFPALVLSDNEPSVTPSATVHGVKVHSGDILVSRGGAPTSSLIARGNDYPGSFSHVALLHIEPGTGRISIIESLIESGVVISTLDEYLGSQKLRLLVLRPRSDLPALAADPMRPHQAAAAALTEARRRHIPYDFAMDYQDPAKQFCSEVASAAYRTVGIRLWMGVSYLSSPTVTAWLASIGVRHFETQEPADLEYDSQLRVVAEWRGRDTLFRAHVDDAVTDVLIEEATPGEPLPYSRAKLPLARLAKAYSALLNTVGRMGPIPEGLSATAALRVERYRLDHRLRVERLLAASARFQRERGYLPPYWELIRLARENKS